MKIKSKIKLSFLAGFLLFSFFVAPGKSLAASGNWQYVGASGFSPDMTSANKIAFDQNNVPYVVFIDHSSYISSTPGVTVMKYWLN